MDLVSVRTFDNYFNASITLTKLQDAGVECYLQDENIVTIGPFLSNSIGGIKLMVKEDDLAETEKLLHEFDEAYRKAAVCPKCSASAFVYIAKPGPANFLTAIITWIFSNFAVATQYVYHCENCGYECEQLPEN